MARNLCHAIAFFGAGTFGDFAVVVGVRTDQFEIVGNVAAGFQFQAAYPDFTHLTGDVVFGDRQVFLSQVEHGSG
ncbi:hypothetical protein D3C73_1606010 [compost metagenome]